MSSSGQEHIDRSVIERHYAFLKRLSEQPLSWLERVCWKAARSARFDVRIIWGHDGTPYLLRVYLLGRRGDETAKRTFKPHAFLHYFFRSDADSALHNHPWDDALSFVLTKGYLDHRLNPRTEKVEQRYVRPGRFNRIGQSDFHRVQLIDGPCWTLFLPGKRTQPSNGYDWGFLEGGKYTAWKEFRP